MRNNFHSTTFTGFVSFLLSYDAEGAKSKLKELKKTLDILPTNPVNHVPEVERQKVLSLLDVIIVLEEVK